MFLVNVAIKRPVTIAMFTVAAIIFGMVSLSRLQVNLLPDITYPTLTIRTLSAGSAPSEIETLLTRPVEESLGVIKHVRKIRSRSQTGQSDVTLEFDWGTNMDFAVLDVREKLDALELPREVRRPLVMRFDPSSEPVFIIGLQYKNEKQEDNLSALKQLRRYAEQQVQKKLESQTGVAAVKINGGLEDEIQVLINQARLDQLNLTIDMLITRISNENVNLSGGRVEEATLKYLVRTLNQFTSIQDIENIIIGQKEGSDIYLRDVAHVVSGHREQESIIRINGDEAVEIAIYKEGDVNVVSVADDIKKQLVNITRLLPGEYQLTKLYDESVFITQSISNVAQAAVVGGLLAILVLYLFLGNAWATAIISIAIPVSVIAAFNMMYASNVSLNIMSLGGKV